MGQSPPGPSGRLNPATPKEMGSWLAGLTPLESRLNMTFLAETAQRCNARNGLDYPSRVYRPDPAGPALSRGGAMVYQLTRREPATCNAIAELAGIGCEVAK